MSSLQLTRHEPNVHRNRWLERLIAILAVVNLGLVFFDLSYVPWRNFYLHELPSLTQFYDPVKGIEPHRETQRYLHEVDQLKAQVTEAGLESPQAETLLQELRQLSNEMIEDNPFAVANKSGTLEKIKKLIRNRVGQASSHAAFSTFWSQDYLAQVGWQSEIDFFNSQIRPLIQTNYYRNIGINGKFINDFWKIDLPFAIVFGLDFLVRTFLIGRRYSELSWLQAMLRRWYDLFLLLPFWRWLRVLPVTIRLSQADLVNLEPVRQQISHDFAVSFAQELTEVVGIRVITQLQESIRRGEATRWLLQPDTRRPYIDINSTNEVQAIANHLLHMIVYKVLPKVQPDIQALMHSSMASVLNQSAAYQQLQRIPGLGHLPTQLTEQLVTDLSHSAYTALTSVLEDPVVVEQTNRLMQRFGKTLEAEMQNQTLQSIQPLLIDLLEEIKINYVKGIAAEEFEKILEEAEQLRQHPPR